MDDAIAYAAAIEHDGMIQQCTVAIGYRAQLRRRGTAIPPTSRLSVQIIFALNVEPPVPAKLFTSMDRCNWLSFDEIR